MPPNPTRHVPCAACGNSARRGGQRATPRPSSGRPPARSSFGQIQERPPKDKRMLAV